jgi:hypothetical protein
MGASAQPFPRRDRTRSAARFLPAIDFEQLLVQTIANCLTSRIKRGGFPSVNIPAPECVPRAKFSGLLAAQILRGALLVRDLRISRTTHRRDGSFRRCARNPRIARHSRNVNPANRAPCVRPPRCRRAPLSIAANPSDWRRASGSLAAQGRRAPLGQELAPAAIYRQCVALAPSAKAATNPACAPSASRHAGVSVPPLRRLRDLPREPKGRPAHARGRPEVSGGIRGAPRAPTL